MVITIPKNSNYGFRRAASCLPPAGSANFFQRVHRLRFSGRKGVRQREAWLLSTQANWNRKLISTEPSKHKRPDFQKLASGMA